MNCRKPNTDFPFNGQESLSFRRGEERKEGGKDGWMETGRKEGREADGTHGSLRSRWRQVTASSHLRHRGGRVGIGCVRVRIRRVTWIGCEERQG